MRDKLQSSLLTTVEEEKQNAVRQFLTALNGPKNSAKQPIVWKPSPIKFSKDMQEMANFNSGD